MTETVYVTRNQYHQLAYHTNEDCQSLPDDYREIEKHKIPNHTLCKSCANGGTAANGGGYTKTCPFCGDSVGKIPNHLRNDCEKQGDVIATVTE